MTRKITTLQDVQPDTLVQLVLRLTNEVLHLCFTHGDQDRFDSFWHKELAESLAPASNEGHFQAIRLSFRPFPFSPCSLHAPWILHPSAMAVRTLSVAHGLQWLTRSSDRELERWYPQVKAVATRLERFLRSRPSRAPSVLVSPWDLSHYVGIPADRAKHLTTFIEKHDPNDVQNLSTYARLEPDCNSHDLFSRFCRGLERRSLAREFMDTKEDLAATSPAQSELTAPFCRVTIRKAIPKFLDRVRQNCKTSFDTQRVTRSIHDGHKILALEHVLGEVGFAIIMIFHQHELKNIPWGHLEKIGQCQQSWLTFARRHSSWLTKWQEKYNNGKQWPAAHLLE